MKYLVFMLLGIIVLAGAAYAINNNPSPRIVNGIDETVNYSQAFVYVDTLYAGEVVTDILMSDDTTEMHIMTNVSINGTTHTHNLSSDTTITALEIVDLTRGYPGDGADALNELKLVRDVNGELDHNTIPEFARTRVTIRENGVDVEKDGRSLGAMISILTEAVAELEAQNALQRTELCRVGRDAYAWC